ncbi:MAG: preprotein translocase subunit SecG, partial [Eubacterium sp.]|nr:preprotein translocase subunit SecG [Eubacterium sp.]
MEMIRTVFTVLFIIVCIALIVVVLMQEGKSAGLGSLSG